jgi:hypothetical protein
MTVSSVLLSLSLFEIDTFSLLFRTWQVKHLNVFKIVPVQLL